MAAGEDSIMGIIAVLTSPVRSSKRTVVGEKITVLIEHRLVVSNSASSGEPVAGVELEALE
jgi:hypothetical protein